MKNKILKSTTLFLGIALLGLSACKKKPEVPFDKVCFATLNYVNYFEGENGNQYIGLDSEGPTEITVKTGARISLELGVEFTDYDVEDKLSRVNVKIAEDNGVTKSTDLDIRRLVEYQNGNVPRSLPAERSFTATISFYSQKGASCTKTLRVNVVDANETIVELGDLNRDATGDLFDFFAPYLIIYNSPPSNSYHTGVYSSTGFDLYVPGQEPLNGMQAYFATSKVGGALKLTSADICKEKNYTPKNPEFGFNGVEMELLNIPNYTGEWNGDSKSEGFNDALVANNLRTYAQLDTMSFHNPVKTLTVQDNQFFKFRTLSGKKGIAVIKQNTTDNSYSNIMFVLQR